MTTRGYVLAFLLTVAIALALVCAITFVVDPFGYRPHAMLELDQAKLSDSSHDRLYRLARFRSLPKKVIVLGDSRAQNMREEYFAERHVDAANLAYGGGTLYEAIDTFWYVNQIEQPTHVVLGLPFNLWSESNDMNRVREATEILSNPLRYYLNYFVLGVAVRNVWLNARGMKSPAHHPPGSRDDFWRFQLNHVGGFYGMWREPRRLRERFESMARYCRAHGVRLLIVIPPTHTDLQKKIADYDLAEEYDEFLRTIAASGMLLNFDVVDPVTSNASNFADPFHANAKVMRDLVHELAPRLQAKVSE